MKDPACPDVNCPGRAEGIEREQQLLAMQREIADEACRVDIECYAIEAQTELARPVFDVSEEAGSQIADDSLRLAAREAILRAVRYLDMRNLLVRPFPDRPHLVSFHPEVA